MRSVHRRVHAECLRDSTCTAWPYFFSHVFIPLFMNVSTFCLREWKIIINVWIANQYHLVPSVNKNANVCRYGQIDEASSMSYKSSPFSALTRETARNSLCFTFHLIEKGETITFCACVAGDLAKLIQIARMILVKGRERKDCESFTDFKGTRSDIPSWWLMHSLGYVCWTGDINVSRMNRTKRMHLFDWCAERKHSTIQCWLCALFA